MQHSFWASRWQQGQIGFHRSEVNPNLTAHWEGLLKWVGAAASANVLVPLCGKSLDLNWLQQQGHSVVGVDLVEQAAMGYFEQFGTVPEVTPKDFGKEYRDERTRILVGDFFELEPRAVGSFALAYDRAALVAVEPHRRREYVGVLARLLSPGAGVLLISFEHDMGSGPPYSVPEVERLFGDHFSVERRQERDILEEEPRFRDRGASSLHEIVWFARRWE